MRYLCSIGSLFIIAISRSHILTTAQLFVTLSTVYIMRNVLHETFRTLKDIALFFIDILGFSLKQYKLPLRI